MAEGRRYPMAAVYVVGGLISLTMAILVMNRTSPEKGIALLGRISEWPAFRADAAAGSPGAADLAEGKRAYEAQEWAAAAEAFGRAAAADSGLPRALFYQGVSLLGADKPAEAEAALQAYVGAVRYYGAVPDDGLYYLAKAYCRMEKGEDAARALDMCMGEGGPMIEDCLKFLKALQNNLMMMPKDKRGGGRK